MSTMSFSDSCVRVEEDTECFDYCWLNLMLMGFLKRTIHVEQTTEERGLPIIHQYKLPGIAERVQKLPCEDILWREQNRHQTIFEPIELSIADSVETKPFSVSAFKKRTSEYNEQTQRLRSTTEVEAIEIRRYFALSSRLLVTRENIPFLALLWVDRRDWLQSSINS